MRQVQRRTLSECGKFKWTGRGDGTWSEIGKLCRNSFCEVLEYYSRVSFYSPNCKTRWQRSKVYCTYHVTMGWSKIAAKKKTRVSLWRCLVCFRVDSTTVDETVPLPQAKNLYRLHGTNSGVTTTQNPKVVSRLHAAKKKEKEKLNFFFPTRSFFYSYCRSSIDRYRS